MTDDWYELSSDVGIASLLRLASADEGGPGQYRLVS